MKIIKSANDLQRYMPNIVAEVEGETSLIDKITSYIDAAENWVVTEFLSPALFDKIVADKEDCHNTVAGIVATEAIKRAIPSLDITLTPNGFGVVNSGAIAPASRDRVERLITEMESTRDGYIKSLIDSLSSDSKFASDWRTCENGKKFGAILPYRLNLPELLGFYKNIWKNYIGLRTRVLEIESYMAQYFISYEYMQELRNKNFGISEATNADKTIIARLIAIIIQSLRSPENQIDFSLREIVDYIRNRPDEFPTWANSDTARLFSPAIFTNKQENNGYFF